MNGKIALEEHFAMEETLADSAGFFPDTIWSELKSRLLDIHEQRLRRMDENGIECSILSLNAPTVQSVRKVKDAVELARRANDYLAGQCAKRPDRFRAFAALPMQDPNAACRELERCVTQHEFVGALVNGFSETESSELPLYYDLPMYKEFWSELARLDAPFYLHPRNPLQADAGIYRGHPWLLGPTWGFAQETAVHALRLMCSGLFDRWPGLKIILGHMGEGLPYMLWRVDHRNSWMNLPPAYPAKRGIRDYLQENFYLTTSGNFRTQSLINAILEIGSDRIMFSTDWPFEDMDHAAKWFDEAAISDVDRMKIGSLNARSLFGLA